MTRPCHLRSVYRPHIAVSRSMIIGLAASVHIACAIVQMVRRRKIVALKGRGGCAPTDSPATSCSSSSSVMCSPPGSPPPGHRPYSDGQSRLRLPWPSPHFSVPGFFWPYYLLLGIAGATHLGWPALASPHAPRPARDRRTSNGWPRCWRSQPSPTRRDLRLCRRRHSRRVLDLVARQRSLARTIPEYKALADKLLP